jgi:hypothetical protein
VCCYVAFVLIHSRRDLDDVSETGKGVPGPECLWVNGRQEESVREGSCQVRVVSVTNE